MRPSEMPRREIIRVCLKQEIKGRITLIAECTLLSLTHLITNKPKTRNQLVIHLYVFRNFITIPCVVITPEEKE